MRVWAYNDSMLRALLRASTHPSDHHGRLWDGTVVDKAVSEVSSSSLGVVIARSAPPLDAPRSAPLGAPPLGAALQALGAGRGLVPAGLEQVTTRSYRSTLSIKW